MGEAFDLYWAARRAVERAIPHYHGRPVVHWSPDTLVDEAIALIPERLWPEARDRDGMRQLLGKFVVEPWPFAILDPSVTPGT